MSAHQAEHRITTMSRLLGVSSSGYYAWKQREPSARTRANERLLERIRIHHQNSDGNYGRIRILKDLNAEGLVVGHNRVARLMRKAGLVGVSRRRAAGPRSAIAMLSRLPTS
jgi:transposase InsO family protein